MQGMKMEARRKHEFKSLALSLGGAIFGGAFLLIVYFMSQMADNM